MKDKQVTIFGGTGFIGRYVVSRLAALGYNIRVATRRPGSAYFLRPAGNVGQVVPFLCDIHDDYSVAAAIEESTLIINLIGILAESGKKNTFEKIHHGFPKRLGRLAKKAGIKTLVHVSSLAVSERASSQYLVTKAKGEKALRKNFAKASILRPSIVFGEEDQFFNRFAQMALFSPALPLIGGGKTKFQPVYVCNVADAIVKCVTDPSTAGKTYELGGPEIQTFKELMRIMLDQIERKRWLVPVPWKVAAIKGTVLQNLPGKLLTRDQVRALQTDSVVKDNILTLADLEVEATPLSVILPTYLNRFKPGGRFGVEEQS